ncbi:MAG: precorrin-6X reductase/cobalamin biosynthetic protein CbiD [Bacteroidetes bacterium]|nr:precorrin-6X reductase/cobalamin biosynthetic protein CbiD [Bacteroidota bacterium]
MILIFGGTTEGKAAVKVVDEAGQPYYYSTKGEWQEVSCLNGIRLSGEMGINAMTHFCLDKEIRLLIDAAHPFAVQLHQTIADASEQLGIPVIRYERIYPPRDKKIIWCEDYEDAVRKLKSKGIQRLLALTGVQTISKLRDYWKAHDCWFRVLQRKSSVQLAVNEGFPSERIVFYHPEEDENKLLSDLHPDAIITKESGESGGFIEKVEAAQQIGISVFVIKRPLLPDGFFAVNGEHGLRRAIEQFLPGFFPLRTGFTTGSCATAASVAALNTILTRREQDSATILLPNGESLSLAVNCSRLVSDHSATSIVIKDAGDDPDVTNGIEIVATVSVNDNTLSDDEIKKNQTMGGSICEVDHSSLQRETSPIILRGIQNGNPKNPQKVTVIVLYGGIGIGRITLPGLGLEIGGPAINLTPRKMIEENLRSLLDEIDYPPSTVTVTLSVPAGAEIAKRTFNPRLGIEGGISIIGTSGIVKPFSSEAFVNSIRKEIEVAKATGSDRLVINSGAKSERYVRRLYPDLPAQAFVHYGNFIGETLKIASELDVRKVTLGIMIGKAVKLAEGSLDTHSKNTTMNRDFLQQIAKKAECELQNIDSIGNITLARELWTLLSADEQVRFFSLLLENCQKHATPLLPNGEITILLLNEEGTVF